jgi:hypothetical protein
VEPTRTDHVTEAELVLEGLSRETDIVLSADGRFSAGGEPVAHPGVVEAFSRWIDRADDGRYVLRNDLHYVYVTVEGAPLHARGLELSGEPPAEATLLLQGGVRERLRPETLREGPDGVLYADGRDGTWPVRLHPAAVLALEPVLEPVDGGVVVRLGDERHPIGRS